MQSGLQTYHGVLGSRMPAGILPKDSARFEHYSRRSRSNSWLEDSEGVEIHRWDKIAHCLWDAIDDRGSW